MLAGVDKEKTLMQEALKLKLQEKEQEIEELTFRLASAEADHHHSLNNQTKAEAKVVSSMYIYVHKG